MLLASVLFYFHLFIFHCLVISGCLLFCILEVTFLYVVVVTRKSFHAIKWKADGVGSFFSLFSSFFSSLKWNCIETIAYIGLFVFFVLNYFIAARFMHIWLNHFVLLRNLVEQYYRIDCSINGILSLAAMLHFTLQITFVDMVAGRLTMPFNKQFYRRILMRKRSEIYITPFKCYSKFRWNDSINIPYSLQLEYV